MTKTRKKKPVGNRKQVRVPRPDSPAKAMLPAPSLEDPEDRSEPGDRPEEPGTPPPAPSSPPPPKAAPIDAEMEAYFAALPEDRKEELKRRFLERQTRTRAYMKKYRQEHREYFREKEKVYAERRKALTKILAGEVFGHGGGADGKK